MDLLRRPRLWVRLASAAAFLAAVWLLLIPRTALYLVDDDGHPYDVRVLYSWGRSDQTLILPKALLEDPGYSGGSLDLVESVRLDCGTAFTFGANEDAHPGDGEEACSAVETPRRFAGLCLIILGSVGLWAAPRLSQLRFRVPWGVRER